MGCSGRYAEVYDFAGFWCLSSTLTGTHTGANDAAILTDANADFLQQGVKVGQFLRNATDNSKARITGVTATTIEGTLIGGTDNEWDTGDTYQVVMMSYAEANAVTTILDIAAADVYAALAAAGACDCNLAPWALLYLKKLNVIDAAIIHNCPCGSASRTWSDEVKLAWLDWIQKQLAMLVSGDLEVCAGETGKNVPALGIAEIDYGPISEQQIIWRQLMRNRRF